MTVISKNSIFGSSIGFVPIRNPFHAISLLVVFRTVIDSWSIQSPLFLVLFKNTLWWTFRR